MTFRQPVHVRHSRGRRWAAAFFALLLVVGGAAPSASAAPSGGARSVSGQSGAEQTLAATSTGTLTVMIITVSGQKLPLANVVVGIYGPLQFNATQYTDASGQTTFTGLRPDWQYTVAVSQRGDHGVWTRLSNYQENVSVVAGSHRWLALRMRLAGSIGGRIVNQSGVPVANMVVRAFGATTRTSEIDYTDADGYYVIRGLSTDNYRVEIVENPGAPQIIRRVVPVSDQHGNISQTAVDFINGILQQPY
jgi:Carboxypeptidase regulatory-like domain